MFNYLSSFIHTFFASVHSKNKCLWFSRALLHSEQVSSVSSPHFTNLSLLYNFSCIARNRMKIHLGSPWLLHMTLLQGTFLLSYYILFLYCMHLLPLFPLCLFLLVQAMSLLVGSSWPPMKLDMLVSLMVSSLLCSMNVPILPIICLFC